MKKLIMALVLMPLMALADQEKVGDVTWSYTVADGMATVTEANPSSGALIIPSTLGGCPVTSIGDYAFDDCFRLTSVTIPSSVTSIGAEAFSGCSGLASITIPSSVTSIGEYAFYNCAVMTSVIIPEGVTSIGEGTFYYCYELTSVTIPSSVTNIGASAFFDCPLTMGALILENVISIGKRAFAVDGFWTATLCVENIVLSDKLTSIEMDSLPPTGRVFVLCSTVDQDREEIDEICERMCDMLGGLYPSPCRKEEEEGVSWYYYWWNPGVVICANPCKGEVVVPLRLENVPVKTLDDYAFFGCSELTSVSIPSGVTSIGAHAFYGCSGLTGVTLPARFGRLNTLFPDAQGLESVTWLDDGSKVVIANSCSGLEKLERVVIPASVMNVEDRAFYNCHELKSVIFEGNAPDVGTEVFNGTPKDLVISVPSNSIGWDGGFTSTALPPTWGGRAIAHVGEGYDWGKGATSSFAGTMTVSNVVVHYVLNSVQPQFAISPSQDMGFVNVITEVKSTGVAAIPMSWAMNYPNFVSKFGSDFTAALGKPTGKIGTGGTPMLVWQDYVAGTDPTNEKDVFTASITIVDGKVTISYTPELDDERKKMRKYTTWGKKSLMDTNWTEVPEGHEVEYNFFKVSVEMR